MFFEPLKFFFTGLSCVLLFLVEDKHCWISIWLVFEIFIFSFEDSKTASGVFCSFSFSEWAFVSSKTKPKSSDESWSPISFSAALVAFNFSTSTFLLSLSNKDSASGKMAFFSLFEAFLLFAERLKYFFYFLKACFWNLNHTNIIYNKWEFLQILQNRINETILCVLMLQYGIYALILCV